jgi:hypothetical protein
MQDLLTTGAAPGFIEKDPPLQPAQDYALLRREGLAHIEKLAHAIWTDYNVHDPGITLLELLCFAITDLGYRAAYPVSDLLSENDRGVPVNRANFHTARQVLTSGPVTFEDLRKLLVDIPGVRNAWIQPHTGVRYRVENRRRLVEDTSQPSPSTDAKDEDLVVVNGLYDVLIEYEDDVGEDLLSGEVGLKQRGTSGEFIDPAGRGMVFHAARPLVLDAVTVYPEKAGDVTVRLVDRQNNVVKEITAPATAPGRGNRLPLNFAVDAGADYRLETVGSSVKLHETRGEAVTYPYALRDVAYIAGSTRPTPERPEPRYPVFYNWEIRFPPVRLAAERTTVTVGPTDPGDSKILPQGKGVAFTALRDVVLESVDVYPDADGLVTVRLLDVAGTPVVDASRAPVQRAGVDVKAEGKAVTIALGFELAGGRSFRLDAKGTTVKLSRTREAGFPFEAPGALRLDRGFASAPTLYFFYRWVVSYPTPPGKASRTRSDVRLRVRDRLFTERNLCEDVVQVCELSKEEIALCADIEVRPSANLDAVLAEIFYRLESHISPPVRFYTLQEMVAKGRSIDAIFEGPRLTHGFIDDQEFRNIARRCELRVSDIVNLLMEANLPDLIAIRNIRLLSFVDGKLRREEPWILPLADDRFRSPSFSPALSKIVFYKNDLPYYANRARQDILLKKKRASVGRTPLRDAEGDFAIPVGEFRSPDVYYPVQNELPPMYHVGQIRVPDSASALRKAQSRQLKAYLLFFEQLLADYLAQLAYVRELFSWKPGVVRTYSRQVIAGIADLDDLYIQSRVTEVAQGDAPQPPDPPHLPLALGRLAETERTAAARRGAFLDHLLARFNEEFTEYSLLMYSIDRARTRANEDKRLFLEDYPASSGMRAEAYDYRFPDWAPNLSGYQRRVYRLLGIRNVTRRRLASSDIEIIEVTTPANGYAFVVKTEGRQIFQSITCESRASIEVLLDFALGMGDDASHYRSVQKNGAAVWELVRRCSDRAQDEGIGWTASADRDDLETLRKCFAFYGESEGFHAIEHVLLRPRTKGRGEIATVFLPIHVNRPGECDCPDVRDPYSFRLTVLLPAWSRRFRDLRFRRLAEQTLRREAPAHVYVTICWISHEQMRQVDEVYEEWAARLAALEPAFGVCGTKENASVLRGGTVPLPEAKQADDFYLEALGHLVDMLGTLVNVHPVARLHDCLDTSGDEPQVSLGNTNLGTF